MENHIQSEQIMDQLDRSKKAMPSKDFLSKMEKMADAYTTISDKITPRAVFMMAASFLLLLAANFLIMNDHIIQDSMQDSTTESTSTYTLIPAKSVYND